MALRFRRSIRLAPGVRLNVSKRGVSVSTGMPGASLTYGMRGLHGNVGIPGTGFSYRERLDHSKNWRKSGDPGVNTPINIQLSLQDDGNILILDKQGQPLSSDLARIIKKQGYETMLDWLNEQCQEINKHLEMIRDIYLLTPPPRPLLDYHTLPFIEPEPSYPILKNLGILGRIFESRRERIQDENTKLIQQYNNEVAEWNRRKIEFEQDQKKKIWVFDEGRYSNINAMMQALELRFEILDWPRETIISMDISKNCEDVFIDIDLPEIDELPIQEASVLEKSLKLKLKTISQTELRKLYMNHIHGIGMRLIGETFRTLPTINTVIVSAYSQRPDKSTGNLIDEYLYSVKVNLDNWNQINFKNLDLIDPVTALERFEIKRDMTTTGIFKAIQPFTY